MADHKACKKYSECDWRISIGYCPENCNHFKHKDEVVVTRCKDCKYCNPIRKQKGLDKFCKCLFWNIGIEPDDYCSCAERKENG